MERTFFSKKHSWQNVTLYIIQTMTVAAAAAELDSQCPAPLELCDVRLPQKNQAEVNDYIQQNRF